MSVGKKFHLSRLQSLLVFRILNCMAKTKLAILPLSCCDEIVKNFNGQFAPVDKFFFDSCFFLYGHHCLGSLYRKQDTPFVDASKKKA